MNYLRPELRRALASDYAIGLMAPAARRRFERLLADDLALRMEVAQWQDTLARLTRDLPEEPLPSHVWRAIVARIEPPRLHPPALPRRRGWRLPALAAGLVLALGIGLLLRPAPAQYSATLSDTGAQPALRLQAYRDHLQIEALHLAAMGNDRSLELWAIPADGVPVSLGLVPVLGKGEMQLSAQQQAVLGKSVTIAVTLEAKGGSPSGKPTGAILYKGVLAAL
ncbi:anti-sigma factor [Pseudomonas sp. HR96]|uniref:anti-sigma factor n=1 Tax=Pseudomonas sp. HR96 TaxID=1027966 RepID=UPI002A75AEB0|nr:anti-sigma factor [Pseudomonas sp. HR96]WPP00309.1 anti-sigma factor [Pseudomonas sp. HR96]